MYPVVGPWENASILFTGPSAQKPWMVSATDTLADLHYVGAGAGTVCVPRFRYSNTERIDNITDWAFAHFAAHYGSNAGITKDGIFAYVYGVLHDPVYRQTYALNLKYDLPRIPLHPDFASWRNWGQQLLEAHIGYQSIEPFPLKRTDIPSAGTDNGPAPRTLLKADRDNGVILLDSETRLSGVPPEAWGYMLGNRSAIEWVLNQHKERPPDDPTVRDKFNSYLFADYKEQVVDLLARVVSVCVKTGVIIEAMRTAARSASVPIENLAHKRGKHDAKSKRPRTKSG